jgi:hypothetical protein
MRSLPHTSARQVFWIVDNGSSHCGWTAAARLSEAFPNAVMIHTGPRVVAKPGRDLLTIVQRKLLPPTHRGLEQLAEQPTAFETRSHHATRPFDRRYNRDDLDLDLDRIAA